MLIKLKKGLPFGKGEQQTMEFDVELQHLTTAHLLAAEEASEKLVYDISGEPQLVSSPFRFGFDVTRRRIKRIGPLQGPIAREIIELLDPDDYQLISRSLKKMDDAAAKAAKGGTGAVDASKPAASPETAERGRVQAVSE
ncbi:hypothetical protein [Aeromonas enteropelogenes]|uniref:hypothetical protein n=1 Tax=Aeromonas enteropelogenes TaxID=29489 RepID=UPI003BA0EF3C